MEGEENGGEKEGRGGEGKGKGEGDGHLDFLCAFLLSMRFSTTSDP